MKSIYYLGAGLFSVGLGILNGDDQSDVLGIAMISYGLWMIVGFVFPLLPNYLNGKNS